MLSCKDGIIGLVVGDAMGVPVEFCIREKLMENPLTEMVGYGSHDVPKGSWSDDSSMTIATMDAIIEDKNINCETIARNFLYWFRDAKYTPTDKVFDIGRTCLQAIAKYEMKVKKAEECGGTGEMDNGNGSLMRILPVAYYCYAKNLTEKEIYNEVKKVSSITHGHEISIMACFIYVLFAIRLLSGDKLEQAYSKIKEAHYNGYFDKDTIVRFDRILKNDISKYDLDTISSKGFVLDTLEATLWVLFNTDSYNQAIIGAINLGNDTDTVGACVGGLAGIYYGFDKINVLWIKDILKYDYIIGLCEKFDEVLRNE